MQEESTVAFAKDIFVVLEHYLAISVGVEEWDDIDVVHLSQELGHVGAGRGGEKNKLQVDTLDFSFSKSHLVLEELEENVILMQI